MTDRPVVLEAFGLTKSYGKLRAVDGIPFILHQDECAGLLDPNGAGKTTAIAMIMGHVTPDAGSVRIEGSPALLKRLRGVEDADIRRVVKLIDEANGGLEQEALLLAKG